MRRLRNIDFNKIAFSEQVCIIIIAWISLDVPLFKAGGLLNVELRWVFAFSPRSAHI